MKFRHEIMQIFPTEFSIGATAYTYKTGSISTIFGFKNTAGVIVPVFIEFNELAYPNTKSHSHSSQI